MTAPETMSVLAVGNLYETDSEGYTTETYWSVSPISTTVISPTANAKTLWVYADAIQMVVPSSWATATSTIATTTNTPTSTGWDSSLPNFHIGPLNFIYSIVVTVAGGIFILIVLCCCYACCRRRPRPRPIGPLQSSFEYRSPERQPISTFQPTSGYGGSTAQPTATLSPEPSARPFCSYGLADDCRSTLKGTCCCACADKRPSPMTREDRIVTYCLFCRLFWAGVPVSLCPKEWELLGPKCAHKDNASCEKDDSSSCCACCDKRKKFLDLDFRVKDYCPPCRRFWEVKRPVEWPAVWARPPVQPVQPTPRPTPAPQPTPPPDRRKAKNKDKSKDIELLTISEKSAAKGPEMEICEADDEKGKNLEDKGPQYDEPQFFDERNPNPRPAASEDGGEILQTIKSISMGDGAVPPEQFGIDDRGPTYAPTPHLQVAADQPSTTGITTGMTSQPNGAPASSLLSPLPASAESSRSSSKCYIEMRLCFASRDSHTNAYIAPLSKTDRQREKERRGLRYQAPKFSVLPGGELAEGSNET